jgi:hypothetical protein
MSVNYTGTLIKREKKMRKHHDFIAVPHLTGAELTTIVDIVAFLQRMPNRGTAQETAPVPASTLPSLQR